MANDHGLKEEIPEKIAHMVLDATCTTQLQSKPFYLSIPVSNSLSSSQRFLSLKHGKAPGVQRVPWRSRFMFPTLRTKNQVFFPRGKTFSKKCQHLFSLHRTFALGPLFLSPKTTVPFPQQQRRMHPLNLVCRCLRLMWKPRTSAQLLTRLCLAW